ncbi:methylated-DNA--[protein]-cysteine S-methyltransferase [Corynebacterium hindlerae]|uniref:Methylated-DNA--protein-cysteine methyltransferase n=1 Tax=Corynebacterium hindlerae TaxID=699041 RepID=A0A7G5FCN8_9CORY|nr:methylated-DNA--[protein]-cysteine S-methyltransferase [Corynebacterium hindlerae]QMV84379.1 methylated-DNA--[protein]-cysteine S-methyltransferase [Corynebacterium hindlerae]
MLCFDTTLGPLTVVSSATGIKQVLFDAHSSENPTPFEQQARAEIVEYLAGERKIFEVPLDRATPKTFGDEVRRQLSSISYGQTKTYGELAKQLGKPHAARAVGTACARNPLPILVPCHRVVGAHGLGGYLGGLETKQYLLELERIHWRS